jgi:DNA (cytosine-5)-methyltransferase 1
MAQQIKFIDLFAGIGGFHLAFESLGAECVFASEKDPDARRTYIANFGKKSPGLFKSGNFNDDILTVDPRKIPDFDILCAGFPCQPFSQAGHKLGFGENYESRGNMFFVLRDIIAARRPKAFFLENVRNLMNHDNGNTFAVIKNTLERELAYDFYPMVVRASDYGLPQHRARVFMIGIDKNLGIQERFVFPQRTPLKYNLSQIFGGKCDKEIGFTLRVGGRGSKFGDRRNWEFYLVDGKVVRLGVREGKMMMGLPDDFKFPVSEVQAMKQLGNGVAIDAVAAVARQLVDYLQRNDAFIDTAQPNVHKHAISAC